MMDSSKAENKFHGAPGHDHYWEIWINPEGQPCYLSPSLYDLEGFNPEEFLKDQSIIKKFVYPDDLHIFESHIKETFEKKVPGEMEIRVLRHDGEIRWLSHACIPVYDETGDYAGTRSANWDITERRHAEEIIKAQRDLALAAGRTSSLQEALQLCLTAAMKVSGFNGGGVFIRDEASGDLNLLFSEGVSNEFLRGHNRYRADSRTGNVVAAGEPYYLNLQGIMDLQASDVIKEKIRSVAIIPLLDKAEIIGSLHLVSFIHNDMPERNRNALETIARQIGSAIARVQDEQKLRISEEKYRAIFENAIEGIFQTAPDGRILSVNTSAAELFGYELPTDLLNHADNVKQFYANPEDRKIFVQKIETAGLVQKYEVPVIRRNGKEILIALSARAVRDSEGRTLCYDCFYEDITERKKMENDLRASEERFRRIVETPNAGIVMGAVDGQILFANQQMAKMIGCPVEELIGTNYYDYVYPEDLGNVADNINKLKNCDVHQLHVQRRYRCRDGINRWGYLSIGRIDFAPGAYHMLVVVSDITELKQVEREKQLLEVHLRQSQKMEAVGTLAGGIAHDFNNILAAMLGFAEMADKENREDVRRKHHQRIIQAIDRAKNLVNQILDFSRMREQERRPMDIKPILKEALSLLRATLPSTIEIKQDIAREDMHVPADATQIHQIIMNLCTNAAHAMREKGGLLDIRLSSIDILHPANLLPPDLPAGSYVQLAVRDTGHGMDAAVKDRIFEPFFTTKKGKEGTGLGLSVVYGIVKSYGGAIDVQSSAGQGTTFTIYLPCISAGSGIEPNHQVDIDLQGHESILFVDDEEALVNMTQTFFELLGYSITATTSSTEALRLFEENPAAFDIVITDMTMPELTGADLARVFLKIRPELPVILCTGYRDSISAGDIRKLKIREFILKPLSLNDLGRLVRLIFKR